MDEQLHNPTPIGAWWEVKGEKQFGQLSALAAELKVDRHTLRDWIAGRRDPRKVQCEKLHSITQLDYYSPQAAHDRMAGKPKKRNPNSGMSKHSSGAAHAREFSEWFNDPTRNTTYVSQLELAHAIGVSAVTVRNVMAGREFPRDKICEKFYTATGLDCFGPGREAARAEHERLIPASVTKKRRAEYLENAEARRAASRESWRKKYEEQRQFVPPAERESLRANPLLRKEVCRGCGEILKDIGPHLALCPAGKMTAAEYKAKWGFLRSRNATRSKETNAKQSAAMKRIRHKPRKFTDTETSRGLQASLRSRRPGSARLEARLNARGRKLGPRPDHWKRDVEGRIISDAKIAQLRLAGVPEKRIGERIGLTLAAVHNRLKRMNYTGRAPAVLHGEPVCPKHFLDLCADFGLTRTQAAKRIGVTDEWASRRLTLNRSAEPVSFETGKAIIALRAELKKKFVLQPSGKAGGRPSQLTPSEKAEVPGKGKALRSALKKVHAWIQSQDKTVGETALWNYLCERFSKSNDLDILRFWPQFFAWVESNLSTFRSGLWVPHALALQFVADDYGASESAVYEALYRKP